MSGDTYPMNWAALKPCTSILRVFDSNIVSQSFQVNDNVIPLTVYDRLHSISSPLTGTDLLPVTFCYTASSSDLEQRHY